VTAPGSVVAPQPGWWVRTERIGTASFNYGWSSTIATVSALGGSSFTYGWAVHTENNQFPYSFPYTLG
jgi:hypothetical protein